MLARAMPLAVLVIATVAGAVHAGGSDDKPWLGVVIGNAGNGALIHEVVEDTPAADAGIRTGDVITKVGVTAVTTSDQLIDEIAKHRVGQDVEFTVVRRGRAFTVRVALTRRLSESELLARRWIGKSVPSLALPNGTTGDLVSVSHSNPNRAVLVLVFFDRHCRTCGPLYRKLGDVMARYPDVSVVGLTSDPPSTLRSVTTKHSIRFPVLHDSSGSLRTTRFRAKATPTAFVVDRDGVITYAAMSDELLPADLAFAVRRAVGARPSL